MENITQSAPNVTIEEYKLTKIIATIGPSTDNYESVLALIKNGANGLRLNFSHGTHEEHGQRIEWVRKAAIEYGKPVAIIQDLQGPKVRLGDFEGIINVKKYQRLGFKYKAEYVEGGVIPTQYDLSKKVKPGERLYIYDGKVRFSIDSISDDTVYATAQNDGILIKRKGMNLPDTDFGGDIITAKDQRDITYGSTVDIDYVALSFVQTAKDIELLRTKLKKLNSQAKIIAKIETKSAVDNLEDIVAVSDAVMIARGDLAVETPAESVPIVQRQIVGLGLKYSKPTIVATQMLASMSDTTEPTRAEVSDVATAVLIGADCLMLSDETASGKYPIEAITTMKRVILYTEAHIPLTVSFPGIEHHDQKSAISSAIITLAERMHARAIVAETKSGATALMIASCRPNPNIPVIAVTNDIHTAQTLAIVRGIKSYVRPIHPLAAQKLTDWLLKSKVLEKGDVVITASGMYPGVVGTTDTIKVRVLE
jgi:pyruvate kinase